MSSDTPLSPSHNLVKGPTLISSPAISLLAHMRLLVTPFTIHVSPRHPHLLKVDVGETSLPVFLFINFKSSFEFPNHELSASDSAAIDGPLARSESPTDIAPLSLNVPSVLIDDDKAVGIGESSSLPQALPPPTVGLPPHIRHHEDDTESTEAGSIVQMFSRGMVVQYKEKDKDHQRARRNHPFIIIAVAEGKVEARLITSFGNTEIDKMKDQQPDRDFSKYLSLHGGSKHPRGFFDLTFRGTQWMPKLSYVEYGPVHHIDIEELQDYDGMGLQLDNESSERLARAIQHGR